MSGRNITRTDILKAIQNVRRELRAVQAATTDVEKPDQKAAYAAAERAQHAAFDLKNMFALEMNEIRASESRRLAG